MQGSHWILGGDLNDIKSKEEKKEGKQRNDLSFLPFRNFLAEIEMKDIMFRGDPFIWANNREGKGFIQERLDKFCGSNEWILLNENVVVHHILRHTSGHAMILLDTKPVRTKTRGRFIWQERWGIEAEHEELMKEIWSRHVEGSRMFKIKQKLEWCKIESIKKERTKTVMPKKR